MADIDAVSSAQQGETVGGTLTWPHTCTGANRILMVGISMDSSFGGTVTGVTYNSTSMTLVGTVNNSNNVRVYLYRLVAPDSGGAHDIVVTFSGRSGGKVCGGTSYTGVHQTFPVGTLMTATGSDAAPTGTVIADSSDLVLDVLAANSISGFGPGTGPGMGPTITATPDGSQTERWNLLEWIRGAGSTKEI
ncbi:hypothetical protein KAR91_31845 [Candidatus Pacearchaeota archaeon]|nr:hypothetical protein [Candidatus Pacearchaeota archaeon]